MKITYDPIKNNKNIAERGISFNSVSLLDFNSALVCIDNRKDYGEIRYIAIGYISDRLYVLVFTETENGIRVISLRKANQREVKHYENH